jgi:hypothetical protein
MPHKDPVARKQYAAEYHQKRRAAGISQVYAKAYIADNIVQVTAKQRAWALANPERAAANKRACYERNKERYNAANKAYGEKHGRRAPTAEQLERKQEWDAKYRAANKEKLAAAKAEWRRNNLGRWNATRMAYKAAKAQRMPAWLTADDKEVIAVLYEQARTLQMHVDHIVPLRGKAVSGLHVPWNLQALTPADNIAKRNKF